MTKNKLKTVNYDDLEKKVLSKGLLKSDLIKAIAEYTRFNVLLYSQQDNLVTRIE
jgi:hypothetical protein